MLVGVSSWAYYFACNARNKTCPLHNWQKSGLVLLTVLDHFLRFVIFSRNCGELLSNTLCADWGFLPFTTLYAVRPICKKADKMREQYFCCGSNASAQKNIQQGEWVGHLLSQKVSAAETALGWKIAILITITPPQLTHKPYAKCFERNLHYETRRFTETRPFRAVEPYHCTCATAVVYPRRVYCERKSMPMFAKKYLRVFEATFGHEVKIYICNLLFFLFVCFIHVEKESSCKIPSIPSHCMKECNSPVPRTFEKVLAYFEAVQLIGIHQFRLIWAIKPSTWMSVTLFIAQLQIVFWNSLLCWTSEFSFHQPQGETQSRCLNPVYSHSQPTLLRCSLLLRGKSVLAELDVR